MPPAAAPAVCGALALAALTGCGASDTLASSPAAFTVLGRWQGSLELTYRVEPADDEPLLGPAVREATEVWNASGVVRLHPAPAGETADVSFSFQEGAHGSCQPFGGDESLAHAGPQASPSFVHFDRDRTWMERDGKGHVLGRAAAHELGHVLGIGHSGDEDALMYPVPDARAPSLTASDAAALQSLYGGGTDGPGDLAITTGSVELPTAVLRRVAPATLTDVGVLDTDGDGDEELLVWRTDAAGFGSLVVYHFEPGPRLARTVGPVPGIALPGARHVTGTTADEERLLITLLPDGRWQARSFDAEGLPRVRGPGRSLELGAWSDAEGDGVWDVAPPEREREQVSEWTADLDGDGRLEHIGRR